jgi:hypothetical protein
MTATLRIVCARSFNYKSLRVDQVILHVHSFIRQFFEKLCRVPRRPISDSDLDIFLNDLEIYAITQGKFVNMRMILLLLLHRVISGKITDPYGKKQHTINLHVYIYRVLLYIHFSIPYLYNVLHTDVSMTFIAV